MTKLTTAMAMAMEMMIMMVIMEGGCGDEHDDDDGRYDADDDVEFWEWLRMNRIHKSGVILAKSFLVVWGFRC